MARPSRILYDHGMFGEKNTLRRIIVQALSAQAPLTAEELQRHARRYYRGCSIQAVYKELRALESRSVVMRFGRSYSLQLVWVMELQKYAEQVQRTYISQSFLSPLIRQKALKACWNVSSLAQANYLWSQLDLAIRRLNPGLVSYSWANHAWFYLASPEHEALFAKVLTPQLGHLKLVTGGVTYLDREYARSIAHSAYSIRLNDEMNFPREVSFGVLGDLIISIRLGPRATSLIDEYFANVRCHADTFKVSPAPLFTEKFKIRIILERAPRKAEIYLRKFREFWGD